MNFFLDRNMPAPIAPMLAALEHGNHVVRHHDQDNRFHPQTTDIEWISTLGKDSLTWIALTGDGRILKRVVERKALSEANMTFFVMNKAWTQMRIYDYAWRFLKVWPSILDAAKVKVPTIFEIGAGASLKVEQVQLTS